MSTFHSAQAGPDYREEKDEFMELQFGVWTGERPLWLVVRAADSPLALLTTMALFEAQARPDVTR